MLLLLPPSRRRCRRALALHGVSFPFFGHAARGGHAARDEPFILAKSRQ
jgi:hypothetical protein